MIRVENKLTPNEHILDNIIINLNEDNSDDSEVSSTGSDISGVDELNQEIHSISIKY